MKTENTLSNFENIVIDKVKRERISYIEAIAELIEENDLDMARISKLITKPLKEKIENEAISLNLLKIKQRENLNFLF